MIALSRKVVDEIKLHARESFPAECCGAVLESEDGELVRRITNIQDRLHAEDPLNFPRTAVNGYHMDEHELFELLRDVDTRGWLLKAFYHSHPNHGAYFSAEDTRRALLWGEPAYPGTAFIVISVFEGDAKEIRAYGWDAKKREFVEEPLVVAD